MIDGIDTTFKSQSGIVKNKSFMSSNTQNYILSGWPNEEQNCIKPNVGHTNSKNYVSKSSIKTDSTPAAFGYNNDNKINFGFEYGNKQNNLDGGSKNK